MKKNNWKIWQHNANERQELFRPGRDWRIMLAITLFGIAATFALYFWLKGELNNLSRSEIEITASSTAARFTRADLVKYADEINARQTQFDALLKTPPSVSDPSL